MHLINNIFLIISLLLLSSCFSKLAVKVHSFDMDKMEKSAQYKKEERKQELRIYDIMLLTDYYQKIGDTVTSVVKDTLKAWVRQNKLSGDDVQNALKNAQSKFNDILLKNKELVKRVRDALFEYDKLPTDATKSNYDKAYNQYLAEKSAPEVFWKTLAKDELEMIESDIFNLGSDILKARETVDRQFGVNFLFGGSVLGDGMASFVAKAPEDFWRKYKVKFYSDETNLDKSKRYAKINVTKISTFIGNSDVAIKMDGPGNFIIKGVRLDADEAFRTSFKVLSQSIKYLTYASGIPTASASGSGTTAAPTAKIPEIQNLEKNKAEAEQLSKNYELYTDAFLKIVESHLDDLISADDTKRKNAIDALKKAYLFYKSQLKTN
jgi:hypothetical protein